jgi:hypothetical protein
VVRRPSFGDFRKEAVLNGVPFGSACGVVGHGESQTEGVGQLRLELGFPATAPSAIAATSVAQDKELPGARIAGRPFLSPPMCNSVCRKGGGVMRDADHDRPPVGEQIVDTVRDGDTGGIRTEIVIIDEAAPWPAGQGGPLRGQSLKTRR